MNILTIRHDSPSEYLALYNGLIQDVFGFSFEDWHKQGHWTQDYTGYAIIEDGCMAANASVYRMDMLVNGIPKTCWQIGAVATRQEWRGKGLSRIIMEHILHQHPGETFFLCANHTVLDFYPRFGFHRQVEKQPRVEYMLNNEHTAARKLSVQTHRQLIASYLLRRSLYSSILDCANAAPINWFHLMTAHPDHIYEIPALQVMLVAEQYETNLTIYDICATKPVAFDALAAYLPFKCISEIRLGFNPDWLGLQYQKAEYQEEDSALFIRGNLDMRAESILPMLMRT